MHTRPHQPTDSNGLAPSGHADYSRLAVAVPVRIGIVTEDVAEVLAGLEVGEAVIVGEAAQTVAPGMPVRVQGDGIAGP